MQQPGLPSMLPQVPHQRSGQAARALLTPTNTGARLLAEERLSLPVLR